MLVPPRDAWELANPGLPYPIITAAPTEPQRTIDHASRAELTFAGARPDRNLTWPNACRLSQSPHQSQFPSRARAENGDTHHFRSASVWSTNKCRGRRPTPPQRSDDEIAHRVATMVAKGEIKPELAPMFEKALRSEADGRSVVMRNPGVKPKPPRRPSWSRWE